jgi:xanthine dehydrogenase accessory factor
MSRTMLELAYQLTQAGEPFVLATVVWCEHPTSAKPGAQAIIHRDGEVSGWIGGSCAQPVVVREARRALQEGGDSFLLRLGTPEEDLGMARHDVRAYPMTCSSGGALDIYMEPHLPPLQLLLIGDSPVNAALRQLAPVLDFTVAYLASADLSQVQISERTYILVATHGEYDEDALMQALASPAVYIGMVASRRRADSCRAYLRASGIAEQDIARLKAPAGLDIGAVTPEEIAASILAELVQRHRAEGRDTTGMSAPGQSATVDTAAVAGNAETAIDPVCGMIVEAAAARHYTRYEGRDYYFCCPACKRLFERNPEEYLVQRGKTS